MPHHLTVGIGCASAATAVEISAHVDAVLAAAGLDPAAVAAFATVEARARHPGLRRVVEERGRPLLAFPAPVLAEVTVPTPSAGVRAVAGTPSVAEAAALRAAGDGAVLVVAKRVRGRVTVAVARGVRDLTGQGEVRSDRTTPPGVRRGDDRRDRREPGAEATRGGPPP